MKQYKKIDREEYRKAMLEASKDPEFIKRNEDIMKEFEGIDAEIESEWNDKR